LIKIARRAEPYFHGRMNMRYLAVHCSIAALVLGGTSLLSAAPANRLTKKEKAAGWKLLFDGHTTHGWRTFKKQSFPSAGWVVEDGWLHCLGKGGGSKGGGDIITDAEFNDFELQWDWKLAPDGNSGVKYFVIESRQEALGHEYQMIDDPRTPDAVRAGGKHLTASFYDVLAPGPTPLKPPGEINHSRILVRGNHVEHWLNGVKVLAYECGSPAVMAAVAASKFKHVAGFGDKVRGHILLQDHYCNVWFRNVKIRALPEAP
jgi:3-keto-disaccharide hydrolase